MDNRPDTFSDKQVLCDIFGSCHYYPTITSSTEKDAPCHGETLDEQTTSRVKVKQQTMLNKQTTFKVKPALRGNQPAEHMEKKPMKT